jgi:hypothetical protein
MARTTDYWLREVLWREVRAQFAREYGPTEVKLRENILKSLAAKMSYVARRGETTGCGVADPAKSSAQSL